MAMSNSDYQSWYNTSYLSAGNFNYIDELFEQYLENPNQVPPEWKQYFETIMDGHTKDVQHKPIREYFKHLKTKAALSTSNEEVEVYKREVQVLKLINAYRTYGHHEANLDPLNLTERRVVSELTLEHWGLNDSNLNDTFGESQIVYPGCSTIGEVYRALRKTYCGNIGIEYLHITDAEETKWIEEKFEMVQSQPQFTPEEKKQILNKLIAADGLEKYLGFKYVGQKRFSLEGGDSLIPMLNNLIVRSASYKVKEFVMGMAHRGRLNVLVNVLGKSPETLFQEFEGKFQQQNMSGDVKYHMGFSADVENNGWVTHLALAFNPSHLEIIAPVVEGSVRARQRRRNDVAEKKQVVPIIIHGDAAFAGQGVVMETFNFSQARGYATGGTIHIIINNQIGFTTSNPLDARSTLYCSDIAKMVQAPIFHVNANDPESAVYVAQVALDYRMKFKKDVVIDLVCYRRHGHNEADDPSITQPIMYQAIQAMPMPYVLYAQKLTAENIVASTDIGKMENEYRDKLDKGQPIVKTVTGDYEDEFAVNWTPYLKDDSHEVNTGVQAQTVLELANQLHQLPKGFTLHPTIKKVMDERVKMAKGEIPMNWGFAEIMAYATILQEGYSVRISGQDCSRGTFSHRHAVLHDYKNGNIFVPLLELGGSKNNFIIIDSILSEEAVVAFEYGYTTAEPNALVIWEAQFGDFVNGAQVVIDQFISSGEQKWGRLSGLVMLLPHGYEGQGPEHSSARLERFLQLCAERNMQVCVPTTPAQAFHMLRRQMLQNIRKPLIVMTPKSLLRHKLAVSTLADLASKNFQLLIPEIDKIMQDKVKRVILCSGKVFYDLLEERRNRDIKDIALIRVEQLYPFPETLLVNELKKYAKAQDIVWCQEEPQNQGAWYSSQHHMHACLQPKQVLRYVGRTQNAATAVGSYKLHNEQQKKLINEALS